MFIYHLEYIADRFVADLMLVLLEVVEEILDLLIPQKALDHSPIDNSRRTPTPFGDN